MWGLMILLLQLLSGCWRKILTLWRVITISRDMDHNIKVYSQLFTNIYDNIFNVLIFLLMIATLYLLELFSRET